VADLLGRGRHGARADADGLSDDDEAKAPEVVEGERVSSAIRTDFILSAEIMAITLATLTGLATWVQGVVWGWWASA